MLALNVDAPVAALSAAAPTAAVPVAKAPVHVQELTDEPPASAERLESVARRRAAPPLGARRGRAAHNCAAACDSALLASQRNAYATYSRNRMRLASARRAWRAGLKAQGSSDSGLPALCQARTWRSADSFDACGSRGVLACPSSLASSTFHRAACAPDAYMYLSHACIPLPTHTQMCPLPHQHQ